MKILMIQ